MELSLTLNSTLPSAWRHRRRLRARLPWRRPVPLSARAAGPVDTVAGMPPVSDATNLYGDAGAGKLSEATKGALARVYVPHLQLERRLRDRPGDLQGRRKFKVGLNRSTSCRRGT
jgi:hypothetical protein